MASVFGDLSLVGSTPLTPNGEGESSKHRTRVLVLDDQVAIRSLLGEVLTANHYHVSLAKNLVEAAQLIELSHFDVIIVDIFLSETSPG